jgi:hypothetical protein
MSARRSVEGKNTAKAPARKVLYKKPESAIFMKGGDHPPIDAEKAMEILGWKEEGKAGSNVKYHDDYLLLVKGEDGKNVKVRCVNNVTNRPLYLGNVESLKQEILRGRWEFNGEPILIGKTGLVLNGQHQLIAVVLASIDYGASPDSYPSLDSPPSIAKNCVVGLSEEDHVVNTMDTCKPRKLDDVIYRSVYFADQKPKDRKVAASATARAIQMLWVRTGENLDGFSKHRNHSEMVNYLERHRGLLACVENMLANEPPPGLEDLLNPGTCSALQYLFAASKTDPEGYLESETLNEEAIDWEFKDRAEDFFNLITGDGAICDPIRKVWAEMKENGLYDIQSKVALLTKTWLVFSAGKKPTVANLKLKVRKDDDGYYYLEEEPTAGGIDVGPVGDLEPAITPEKKETEKRQAAILEKKKAEGEKKKGGQKLKGASSEKPKTSPKTQKAKASPLLRKSRWWMDGEEAMRGKVIRVEGEKATLKVLQGFPGTGNEVEVPVANLQEKQPT